MITIDNFVFLDIETTGLNGTENGIISIGCVSYSGNNRFYEVCRIGDDVIVSEEALKVNGFKLDELKKTDLNSEKVVIENFLNWASSLRLSSEKLQICGHNVHFDCNFLVKRIEKYGLKERYYNLFHKKPIDTYSCFMYYMIKNGFYSCKSSFNLEEIVMTLNIEKNFSFHNALNDAMYSRLVFIKIMEGK